MKAINSFILFNNIENKKSQISSIDFNKESFGKEFPLCKNDFFELKTEFITKLKIKDIKTIDKENNRKTEKLIEKRKNYLNNNKGIILTLIKIIIISIFHQIKSNMNLKLFHFQYYSKITLKVKGIGVSSIIGNHVNNNFSAIHYLKEVYINGQQQNIDIKYDFNQTENIVIMIWDDNLNNCSGLFCACSNITEIDLSKFNSSQVINMRGMFDSCMSLTSIDLSNLDTSKVTTMRSMFWCCNLLTSINLSSFGISQVTNMYYIFYKCSSLTSLDLSSFDTSQVETMNGMFRCCSSLTSLNLSSFNTSNVEVMDDMFNGCSSLTSLDLSNFNTSKVITMRCMFDGCSSLTSLNLSNFNTLKVTGMDGMFSNCLNLEYINLNNFDESKLSDDEQYYRNIFYNITDNAVICIKEANTELKIFPQVNNRKCYVIDCSDNWKSKQKKIINNTNECIESCNENSLYPFEYNGRCYENCSNGFLNDENEIKKCKCELDECLYCPNVPLIKGLCTECNTNYYTIENYPYNLGEYIKCFKNLQGYYLDNCLYKECYYTCKTCNTSGNSEIHNCLECNDNYPIKIENNNFLNCYDNFNFDIQDVLNKNETNLSVKEEIEYYDNIIKVIEKGFIDNYNTSKLDNGQDEVIKTEKMTVTLTTVQNQKENINNNMTIVDLGECEELLRKEYNISINETLYMKKIDIKQEEMNTLKVEYDIYCKLFGTNLIKLNLTVCKNSKISIFIPIVINEDLDKLNRSSGYYNDICYTTTSDDGTDIIMKDRQKEFIDKNKIICQEDCDFSKYNSETFMAECSCEVKESSQTFAEMKINKKKIFENFKNIKNIINFNFLICYKILLNKEGIINNVGSYLLLVIIFFNIITIFLFSTRQFHLLKKIINKIVKKTKANQIDVKEISIFKSDKKRNSNKKSKINKKYIKNSKIEINSKNKMNDNIDIISKKINIKNYIDEEINDLSYDSAKKYDKRTYFQYYISLLKTQHSLLCALFNNNDYNSGIIKMNSFFIGFAIEYIVNALFYNDDTMHKIYESKGQFDLETQLPIIVYSS